MVSHNIAACNSDRKNMRFQGMATPCSPTRRASVRNKHLPGHTAMMPRTVALKLGRGGAVVVGCGQAPRAGAGGDGAQFHQSIDIASPINGRAAPAACHALRCAAVTRSPSASSNGAERSVRSPAGTPRRLWPPSSRATRIAYDNLRLEMNRVPKIATNAREGRARRARREQRWPVDAADVAVYGV